MRRDGIDKEKLIGFCNRYSVLLHAALSFLFCFLIEAMSRHGLRAAALFLRQRPVVFFYNTLLIFVSLLPAYLLRRRVFYRATILLFWFLMGLTNGILLKLRVTPFTGTDLLLLGEMRRILRNYLSVPLIVLIFAVLIGAAFLCFFLWLKGPRFLEKRNIWRNLILVAAGTLAFVGFTHLAIRQRVLVTHFGNLAAACEDNGFPYYLMITAFDLGIDQPNGYSGQMMERILAKEESLPETEGQPDVNLIFVQLESFFDPNTVRFLEISEDPIPNFHRLQSAFSSGSLHVPVVGAGTVNTEFECITGMSLRYFGAGEYPYMTVLNHHSCESVAYDLRSLGYTAHAVHNNEANFYSRRNVFSMLGFDSFTSGEYMPNAIQTTETGFLKDEILTEEVIKCLDATDGPDYVYTISVQAHGDYPTEPLVEDPPIRVTGAGNREKNNTAWEYYCKQIHETDAFVGDLVEALQSRSEPTVMVLYGDHLPSMGLTPHQIKSGDLYTTPYVIWDNLGLEKEDETLTSYQLASEVLDRVGIHTGTMVRYHQARRGTRYYQKDMDALQYDMLYGEAYVYGGTSPCEPTELAMGVVPIEVTSLRQVGETAYVVFGHNFTPASRVEINGKMAGDTVFVNDTQLAVTGVEIAKDDQIAVAQQSSSSTGKALSATEAVAADKLLAAAG